MYLAFAEKVRDRAPQHQSDSEINLVNENDSLKQMAQCHFSYLVEKALDLFHNELHRNVKPWFDSQLVEYEGNQKLVKAVYEVSVPNFLNPFN